MTSPEYTGNVLLSPGFSQGGHTTDDEIMYSMAGYTQSGITIKPGQGVLLPGSIMARETASKMWVLYGSDDAGPGADVARGVLRKGVNTGTDPEAHAFQGNIVTAGLVKNSKLSGMDPAAITALNGRVDTVLDLFRF